MNASLLIILSGHQLFSPFPPQMDILNWNSVSCPNMTNIFPQKWNPLNFIHLMTFWRWSQISYRSDLCLINYYLHSCEVLGEGIGTPSGCENCMRWTLTAFMFLPNKTRNIWDFLVFSVKSSRWAVSCGAAHLPAAAPLLLFPVWRDWNTKKKRYESVSTWNEQQKNSKTY